MRWKQILSWVLCLSMLASMLPGWTLGVHAEGEQEEQMVAIEETEAASTEPEYSEPIEETEESENEPEETPEESTEAEIPEESTEAPEEEIPEETTETSEEEVPASPYADWTVEQLMEEYRRLMDAGDEEAFTAFLDQLADEQYEALALAMEEMPAALSDTIGGSFGENLEWSIDEDGILTISGTGAMPNFYNYSSYPWYSYWDQITKLVISEGVTSIGHYSFYGCSGLTSVTIPSTVTSIGNSAFSAYSQIQELHLTDIEKWLKISFSDSSSHPFCYTDLPTQLYVNGQPVSDLFIPEGVTSIGSYAFSGCSGLTSVTIPEGVTSIGDSSFEYCSGLTSITIPEGVTSIGDYAFTGCSRLTSVTIPSTVTSIGEHAFEGCSSLTSITIPEGVTSIGRSTFSDCRSLTSVTIPEGVTSIGRSTFSGCGSLTSVTIPKGVTSIGSFAFSGCSSLSSITIPEGVTSIEGHTFQGCNSLTSVIIPASVTSISEGDGKSGGYAFYRCSSLTSVEIPESVTVIGGNTFNGCISLTSITIPQSISEIGNNAFASCRNLNKIVFEGNLPNIGTNAFFGVTANAYYPAGNETYANAEQYGGMLTWIPYCANHIEVIDQAVEATCTESGKTEGKHCSVCNTVIVAQETVEAKGHTFLEEWKSDASGHWHICRDCGAIGEVEAHVPNISEATQTQNKECTECGYIIQPMQAHTHSLKKVNAKAATCTEPGNKVHYACACGKLFDTSLFRREIKDPASVVMAPLGHSWVSATCTEAKHCKRCGMTEGEALGHAPSEWKNDLVSHWKTCTRSGCGKQLEKADHVDSNRDQRCDICDYSWKNTSVVRSIAVGITNVIRSIFK